MSTAPLLHVAGVGMSEATDMLIARVMRLQQVAACVTRGIHTAEAGGAPHTSVEQLYNLLTKST